MRSVKLITYNPETESYEMSLGTLTTNHFTSEDITCTEVNCTQVKFGNSMLDEVLLSQLIDGLGNSSGGPLISDTGIFVSVTSDSGDFKILSSEVGTFNAMSAGEGAFETSITTPKILLGNANMPLLTLTKDYFDNLSFSVLKNSRAIENLSNSLNGSGESKTSLTIYEPNLQVAGTVKFDMSKGFVFDQSIVPVNGQTNLTLGSYDRPWHSAYITSLTLYEPDLQRSGTLKYDVVNGFVFDQGIYTSSVTVGGYVRTPEVTLGTSTKSLTLNVDYFENLSSSVAKNSRAIENLSNSLNGSGESKTSLTIYEPNLQVAGTVKFDMSKGFVFDQSIVPVNGQTNLTLGSYDRPWNYAYLDKGLCIHGRVSTNFTSPKNWDDTNSVDVGDIAVFRGLGLGQVVVSHLDTLNVCTYVDNLDISYHDATWKDDMSFRIEYTPIGGLVFGVPCGSWLLNFEGLQISAGTHISIDPDDPKKIWFISVKKRDESTLEVVSAPDVSGRLAAGMYRILERLVIPKLNATSFVPSILLQRIA